MNDKNALLLLRIDLIYSLVWFALDALWTTGFPELAAAAGFCAIVVGIVATKHSPSPAMRVLNVFAVLWVLMDLVWIFDELVPFVSENQLHHYFCAVASCALLVSLWRAFADMRKCGGGDYWGLANTALWFATDAIWLLGYLDICRPVALLAVASGVMTVIRSRNLTERIVNTAMVCWLAMDMAELVNESFELAFLPWVGRCFLVLTLALLAWVWIKTSDNKHALDCFRKVRLEAHELKDPVSVMPPSDMNMIPVERDGYLELLVDGRIDSLTADRFLKTVIVLVEKGHRVIQVDARGVNYISSLGLRVLLQSRRALIAKGGSFTVHNASSNVLQIIFMAGFDEILGDNAKEHL